MHVPAVENSTNICRVLIFFRARSSYMPQNLMCTNMFVCKRTYDRGVVWSAGPLIRWSADPLGPLVRWFADPLVRWSAGPLIRWSADPLVRWSADPLIRWSAACSGWSADPLIRLVRWSVNPLVRWSADPLIRWSANPLIRWSARPLIRWPALLIIVRDYIATFVRPKSDMWFGTQGAMRAPLRLVLAVTKPSWPRAQS